MKGSLKLVSALWFFMLFVSTTTFGQSVFYYYGQDKIYLEPSTEKILVRFTQKLSFENQKQILGDPILEELNENSISAMPGIVVLKTKSGINIEQINQYISRIEQRPEVLTAAPFYKTLNDPIGKISHIGEVLVKLRSSADFYKLQEEAVSFSLTY